MKGQDYKQNFSEKILIPLVADLESIIAIELMDDLNFNYFYSLLNNLTAILELWFSPLLIYSFERKLFSIVGVEISYCCCLHQISQIKDAIIVRGNLHQVAYNRVHCHFHSVS